MADAYTPDIPYVQDGEAVAAAVANRPTRTLAGNDQYLKDRLDGAALGEALVAFNRTLDPALRVGQPAAYDPVAARFTPALAELVVDTASGALVPSARSQAVGLLVNKASATLGDLLVAGVYPVDLTASAGAGAAPGLYYLSSSTPGGLTRQKPPVAAPVLFYDGASAYFSATLRDGTEAHSHYSFALTCAPAGNNVVTSMRHTIPAPDPTLPGWLPAGHATFGGRAPHGAVWGYNIAKDAGLSSIWPPVPLGSLNLWWDKGDGSELGAQLVRGGSDPSDIAGLWYADATTLWWLSDCDGDVPWPVAYDASSPPPPLPTTTVPPTCPRPTAMRLVASFTEMLFATDKSVVTSLQPAPGSPITVSGCTTGTAAQTGALQLGLNLAFLVGAGPVAGASVFKQLSGTTFEPGNVVEKLVAGANVTLTPTIGTASAAQGTVTIDVATDLAGRELSPTVVSLGEAKERTLNGLLYLGFPANRASSIRLRFDVPSAGLPASPQLAVRLLVHGTATGTLPATTMSYRAVPRPGAGLAVTPPSSDTTVACNTNVSIATGQYVECQSAAFNVNPGDTVFVSFNRGTADGYGGEVGVIRSAAIVLSGS